MSGVIDADGTQWERCNGCGEFCNIDYLYYEQPSEQFKYGRDLCPKCAKQPDPEILAMVARAFGDIR